MMESFDPLKSLLSKENEIKEAWEIVQIFESERAKFATQKEEYSARLDEMKVLTQQIHENRKTLQEMEYRERALRDEVLKVRKELNELEHVRNAKKRNIHHAYDEVEGEIKHLNSDKEKVEQSLQKSHSELKRLKQEIVHAEKVLKERKKQVSSHVNTTQKHASPLVAKAQLTIPFPPHEKQVEVQSKEGKKVVGNPYKKLYQFSEVKKLHQALEASSEDTKMLYRNSKHDDTKRAEDLHKQIETLKQTVLNLELENAKLGVEVRDLKSEKALETLQKSVS
jgi:myosin heavy subunit